ncbi:hypothetical protein UlMin_016110 [Ulmus minor]
MAEEDELHSQNMSLINPHRRVSRPRIHLRRRKVPMIRLGGKKPRRALVLIGMFRKVRLRWLKSRYISMMRKLKEYYKNLVKEMAEAGASLENFHQRVLVEASFAIPVMGVSFSSYPAVSVSDRPRTLVM